jgi:hypothetical protein
MIADNDAPLFLESINSWQSQIVLLNITIMH